MAEPQETWDFVFPEGLGFDFEDLPVPLVNCLNDGTHEEVEKLISVIRLKTGATQATAWITLFEQLLKIRQFICEQERLPATEIKLLTGNLIKDQVITLPANCIGLQLILTSSVRNFEVRSSLSLQATPKYNFGGVSYLNYGGYTNELVLERTLNFIPCLKGSNKALIYLLPGVSMKVSAVVEK